MTTKQKTIMEVILNTMFISIAIGMFIISKDYRFVRGTLLGSRTFPILIGSIMSVFGIVNISIALKNFLSETEPENIQEVEVKSGNKLHDCIRLYRVQIAIGLMVIYYILLTLIGFILATFIFLPLILYVLEYRKPIHVILVTVLGVAFLYISFKVLLGVPLPEAILF